MKRDDEKELTTAQTNEPKSQPVGDAAGGIVGASAGAGLGALAGPLGILVGAAAGALGGWWAGRAVSDRLQNYDDDEFRRMHRSLHPTQDYDDARDYYQFGHLAGAHPDYQGRDFAEVEPELRRTWQADAEARYGRWDDIRDYVARGYQSRR
ncbi:MAG TPA: hypothetical protein VK864_20285 [Longimicrobiales bacterium]|nr:hypothetical protein [Longimicrobiales bacterium]